MSFVCVDLGASSSRYVSDSGTIGVIPNNMIFMDNMEISKIMPDGDNPNKIEALENCLEVQITKAEADNMKNFPANVLVGVMAEKMGISDRPDVNIPKHKQRINYVSAIIACAVSKVRYDLSEELDLYLAVPPNSLYPAEQAFKENLPGTYTVYLPKFGGGVSVKLKIKSVTVQAESHMAIMSFFFNMSGQIRDVAKPFMNGNVLSLDIGASTTDLAIIEKGRYLDRSGQTYPIGGNVARDSLMNSLDSESYGSNTSFEMAEQTMAEGRVQSGNTFKDATAHVNLAKETLAKQLTQQLQTYFKRINVPIQSINAIVVSGGGSMQSQYANEDGEIIKTTEPLSYFVTRALTQWSADTVVLEYGEDARFANVKGLYVRAYAAKRKEEKEKQQANQHVSGVAQLQNYAQQQNSAQQIPVQPIAQQSLVQPTVTQNQGVTQVGVQSTAS